MKSPGSSTPGDNRKPHTRPREGSGPRCVYCGHPITAGLSCVGHRDLVPLDGILTTARATTERR